MTLFFYLLRTPVSPGQLITDFYRENQTHNDLRLLVITIQTTLISYSLAQNIIKLILNCDRFCFYSFKDNMEDIGMRKTCLSGL